jgi:hypothetical protein
VLEVKQKLQALLDKVRLQTSAFRCTFKH